MTDALSGREIKREISTDFGNYGDQICAPGSSSYFEAYDACTTGSYNSKEKTNNFLARKKIH